MKCQARPRRTVERRSEDPFVSAAVGSVASARDAQCQFQHSGITWPLAARALALRRCGSCAHARGESVPSDPGVFGARQQSL